MSTTGNSVNGGASAAASAVASEEDIMRTRLTIDGDGLGDDRRLTLLLKNVIKFCTPSASASESAANEEEAARSRDRIVALLAQAQWMDSKSKLAQEMNRVEQGNYEQLYREIEMGIQKAHEDIAQAKLELKEARKIRRNKMEYDAMAKVINKNPDRETTGQRLQEIQEELDSLAELEEALDAKLEARKKSFYVLIHSIQQLQAKLDEEQQEFGSLNTVSKGDSNGAAGNGVSSKDKKDKSMDMDMS